MERPKPPATPQCDMLRAASSQASMLLNFIDWLGRTDADAINPLGPGGNKPRLEICQHEANWAWPDTLCVRPERLVYAFLDIDYTKLEIERQALIQYQQDLTAWLQQHPEVLDSDIELDKAATRRSIVCKNTDSTSSS